MENKVRQHARRRRLIVSNVEFGTTTAGRCSVCHRPFEIELGPSEALSEAKERLMVLFEAHVCNEDANQAAARIVRETTEKHS
jgi:hypothetical protein